ncbi:MAG: glycosyltransferase [Chloroflexota bacterium]|nr:glycosyltransferase [Chloroflexota bacterium]MDQ5864724.1 glycosyltransferase [Chloroflexota bacterium]
MRIIVSGAIGRSYVGGQAWVYMQYLAGLRDLGHEVYYLEDCGEESWVYHWEEQQLTTDLDYPAAYVNSCLSLIGFNDRWIYRAGSEARGMAVEQFEQLCSGADLLLVRAVPLTVWRKEYDLPRRRAFIDVDPGFTQVSLLNGDLALTSTVDRCERLFTYGQGIGRPDCLMPTAGRDWIKTVPPLALAYWPVAEGADATHFTTVIRWRGFRDAEYNGVKYGQRDREFPHYIDLPSLTRQPFRVAALGADLESLAEHGWDAVSGEVESLTPQRYQRFIQSSRAEFGVAKHLYVEMRTRWFSDRSVCYLASGRPVLVQSTGIEDLLPTGEGIVTFRSLEEAAAGVDRINSDYERHRRAARQIAETCFAAEHVLSDLLSGAIN